MNKAAFSTALLLLLASCGAPSATDGVTKASEKSSGPFGLIRQADIRVDTAAAFKNPGNVTVGSFIVGFATYETISAKAGGSIKGGTAARNTLLGVDDATMRRITNEAHQNFIAGLKAGGYTVVDRAGLAADPAFAATKSYPNPYEDSSGGFFGGKSVTKYFAPDGTREMKIFQGDITGVLGGFAMNNPLPAAINYAKATGTKVLHVVYLLDFVNNDTSGGVLRWTTAVKVGQGVTVVPVASKIGILADLGGLTSTGNGTISLGQPITSARQFASVSDSTTNVSLGVESAVNVLGFMSGTGMTQSRDYVFTARPNDYASAAADALQQANGALLGKMLSLK